MSKVNNVETRAEVLTKVYNEMQDKLIRNEIDYQYTLKSIDRLTAEEIATIDANARKNVQIELQTMHGRAQQQAQAMGMIPYTLEIIEGMLKAEEKKAGSSTPEVLEKHKPFSKTPKILGKDGQPN